VFGRSASALSEVNLRGPCRDGGAAQADNLSTRSRRVGSCPRWLPCGRRYEMPVNSLRPVCTTEHLHKAIASQALFERSPIYGAGARLAGTDPQRDTRGALISGALRALDSHCYCDATIRCVGTEQGDILADCCVDAARWGRGLAVFWLVNQHARKGGAMSRICATGLGCRHGVELRLEDARFGASGDRAAAIVSRSLLR